MNFDRFHSVQSINRMGKDGHLELAMVRAVDRLHAVQYTLREFSLVLRTRFDDPDLDGFGYDLADNDVERAIASFIHIHKDGEPLMPAPVPYKRSEYHTDYHYPDYLGGQGVIRQVPEEHRNHSHNEYVAPVDGDMLLRKAVDVDLRFGDAMSGVFLVATLLDHPHNLGRPYRDFAWGELKAIRDKFRAFLKDLYEPCPTIVPVVERRSFLMPFLRR